MADTTSDSTTIRKLTRAQDVYNLLDFIRHNPEADSSHWKTLDFTPLGETSGQRMSTVWTEVLSNELLGNLATENIVISPPLNYRGHKPLDRGGLSFAISQRDNAHTRIDGAGHDPRWPALHWYNDWKPNDGVFRQKLVSDAYEPTELWPEAFVTFINPHKYASEDDIADELVDNQAYAWLRRLLSKGSPIAARSQEVSNKSSKHLKDLHRICYELIDNLRHAFEPLPDSRITVPSNRNRSYILFYTTRGGGTESFNRLHIVVVDYGHGLLRTLIPKISSSTHNPMPDSRVIMSELLSGTLEFRGRSRHHGYEKIVELAHKYISKVHITTGHQRSSGEFETILATLVSNDREPHFTPTPTVSLNSRLRIFGTTIHVMLRLGNL